MEIGKVPTCKGRGKGNDNVQKAKNQEVMCFTCGGQGHMAPQCPSTRYNEKRQGKRQGFQRTRKRKVQIEKEKTTSKVQQRKRQGSSLGFKRDRNPQRSRMEVFKLVYSRVVTTSGGPTVSCFIRVHRPVPDHQQRPIHLKRCQFKVYL